MCGPRNTTCSVSWPFLWAGHPPELPLRRAAGSCCVSSPCCGLAVQSLLSQWGHILSSSSHPGDPAPSPWACGDGAELCWTSPVLLAPGLCRCRQWDWQARSRGMDSPQCPVEMAEFPKVGQVNSLTRADLLVTMDIAQLYTNNPP